MSGIEPDKLPTSHLRWLFVAKMIYALRNPISLMSFLLGIALQYL